MPKEDSDCSAEAEEMLLKNTGFVCESGLVNKLTLITTTCSARCDPYLYHFGLVALFIITVGDP